MKRVLFLPRMSNSGAECFCDDTQPTCRHCSSAMRVLLTDESWAPASVDRGLHAGERSVAELGYKKEDRDVLGPRHKPT
jgi:hypothetical protein